MQIFMEGAFKKAIKKLYPKEKQILDKAIKTIQNNPEIGAIKIGDLKGIRVHKFKINKQEKLLAYSYDSESDILTLFEFGSHENFYKKLKRIL